MYRDALNNVQSFSYFILDVSKELLAHADGLRSAPNSDAYDSDSQPLDDSKISRLRALALKRRSKRLIFFNSPDGVKIRLQTRLHQQKQVRGRSVWFYLCGTSAAGRRLNRTSFKCSACDVYLCVRTYPGQRKSCWSLWHEARRLVERNGNDESYRSSPMVPRSPTESSAERTSVRCRRSADSSINTPATRATRRRIS